MTFTKKILSISIAAYNVSAYIEQCLQSVVSSNFIDDLEIFVVDDGATDSTLQLAQKFQEQYPKSVHLVHKNNEGYGSTVNYSIEHATGRFFKLLDGDDWFDTNGLNKLVEDLRNCNSDVIITNVLKGSGEKELLLLDYAKENVKAAQKGTLSTVVGHWGITYKTDLLKRSGINLPLHCLYTDKIYSTIPFSMVNSISVLDYPVYCYRVGRDGQSISIASRVKHVDEYCFVCKILYSYCMTQKIQPDSYVYKRVINAYHLTIKTLLLLKISRKNKEKLIKYEKECQNEAPGIFSDSCNTSTKTGVLIKFLRKTKYVGYWMFIVVPKKAISF